MGFDYSVLGRKTGMLWAVAYNVVRNDPNFVIVYCECGKLYEISLDTFFNLTHKCECQKEKGGVEYNEIIGKDFGEWHVVCRVSNRKNVPFFLCKCSCGREREVSYYPLVTHRSRSCGHKAIHEYKRKPKGQDLPEVSLVGIQAPEAAQDSAKRFLDPSLAEVHIEPTEEQKRMFGLA